MQSVSSTQRAPVLTVTSRSPTTSPISRALLSSTRLASAHPRPSASPPSAASQALPTPRVTRVVSRAHRVSLVQRLTLVQLPGFAVKLKTDEGNWDIVANNTPVFFLRDPTKFPHFIHTQKRDPQTHLKDPDMFWVCPCLIVVRPKTDLTSCRIIFRKIRKPCTRL